MEAGAVVKEFRSQRGIALPLLCTNLTWFAKLAVTTAFLGRLGETELAGGTLGYSFANVTGYAVLTGLCGAMEPICGQAHGAGNAGLLRRALAMATAMLCAASVAIAVVWARVDAVLLRFGQQADIAGAARAYVVGLLPDLAVTSLLSPLRAYLSAQEVTGPALVAGAVGLAAHVPLTAWLGGRMGIRGVAAAVWVSDLAVAATIAAYVFWPWPCWRSSSRWGCWFGPAGGALQLEEESTTTTTTTTTKLSWSSLLRLALPCCLHTCLEWWSYEILVLLTGRLPDARRAVAAAAVALNLDYLLFAAMLALSVTASVRVSNHLGAGDAGAARRAARVSLAAGAAAGAAGGLLMLAARRPWARLYTPRSPEVRGAAARAMQVMALLELINFPLNVCGGIVRATARPLLGIYAVVAGFYLLALPLGVALAFFSTFNTNSLGLQGLLAGFVVGAAASLAVLVAVIARMDWEAEAQKANKRAAQQQEEEEDNCTTTTKDDDCNNAAVTSTHHP